ncbi:aminodeoxychorismate synthase, component I [Nitrospira sp.]|nr:aminodeoxychorismate synthase, component I [Nitrospira sp.]
MLEPSRESYLLDSPQPLTLSFPLASLDPFHFHTQLDDAVEPTFLLESGRPQLGQPCYSFFGERPYATLSHQDGRTCLTTGSHTAVLIDDPLDVLMEHAIVPDMAARKERPPFVGGAVGFLSYDYVRRLETLPSVAAADIPVPDIQMALYDLIGAIDHVQGTVDLMFSPSAVRFARENRASLYEEGRDRLHRLYDRLTQPRTSHRQSYNWQALVPTAGQSRSEYMARVERSQEYIRAGDIYQANLSHRFTFDLSAVGRHETSPHRRVGTALYERLRSVNPSPFGAIMSFDDLTLVSCSPERLVRKLGRAVETRPIAGTRPRGAGAWEDDRLKHELLANAKERAEHLMLVDLERSDLGRVCAYGTVAVDEFMTVEQYSHVSHLVSNIRGTLRPEMTGADVLRAVFPGGTITGVPKVRCMQIIDELEPVRRGIYTGSLGYISRTGDMDWNILIRTMLLRGHHGYLQMGAGIVADSDAQREYEETLHKGQAFFSALRAG